MGRLPGFCVWLAPLALISSPAPANQLDDSLLRNADSVPAVCVFKKKSTGEFIPREAANVYRMHQQSPFLRVYDKNCNGRPDRDETDAARIDPQYDFKLQHVAPSRVVTISESRVSSAAITDAKPSHAMAAAPKTGNATPPRRHPNLVRCSAHIRSFALLMQT
jgi:hypothetical protein